MPDTEVHGSIKNLSASPDIAFQFQPDGQPWATVADAHAGTPPEYRAPFKIRYVAGPGGEVRELWYKGGTSLAHLVPRFVGVITGNPQSPAPVIAGLGQMLTMTVAELKSYKGAETQMVNLADGGDKDLAILDTRNTDWPATDPEILKDASGRLYHRESIRPLLAKIVTEYFPYNLPSTNS